jgi:Mrp family chromosome partitioning ATPase
MAGLLASKRFAFDDLQTAELLAAARERAFAGDAKSGRTVRLLEALAPPNGRHDDRERRGILGALDGRPIADCVIQTECSNLSVLPVGDAQARDAECLSRAGLEQLVEACKGRYDTVLIDTGPVLGSIESAFVIAAADAVLLVVARGERRPPVEDALARIGRFGADVAGVVFNRATTADVAHSSYASRSHSRAAEVP